MPFAHPHLLWLLLVIPPAMAVFFWWSSRRRRQALTHFIDARLLPGLVVGVSARRQKLRFACLIGAAACLILALARPQWGFSWEESKQRGLDIVIAIDTSKSMLAEDIPPNRLARAKLAALDLMQQAKSDRLGVVAFAGSAFLQCPLTIDDSAFRQSIEALNVHIIPQGGSAIAEAIEVAQTAFKEGENHRILVLLSDGEDHDSGAIAAAEKAARDGLKIFTIGIGSPEGEILRVKDAKGRSDYIRDEQGNVVKSRLNEALLQEIATRAGGFYLPLRGAKVVETLYTQGLAPLPKTESAEKLVKRYHERFHWPLGLAIALLLIEMFYPERRREPRTEIAKAHPRKSTAHAAAALLLLAIPATALASPSSALREYKAGQYDEALRAYQQLLQRKSDDPRLHFNAGTAAYRNRQLEDAVKHFNEALSSPDLKLHEQAYYNRGNTLYHLGEMQFDPKRKTEAWEQALRDYESALALNPEDPDARFNREFVKRKLEELKEQQQQQQSSDGDDSDQQQNQQQQQDQKGQDDSQSEQQEQQQQQQDQQSSEEQQQQQAQNQSGQEQEQEQKSAGQSSEQQEKEQSQQNQQQSQQDAGEQEQPDEGGEPANAVPAGQMTPEQAEHLLDAQKGDEKLLPLTPPRKPTDSTRPVRDW